MGSKEIPSLPLFLGPLWSGMVVPVKVPSIDQIDLFKNYLYSIELCEKEKTLKKQLQKNVNMNVQWMWFPKPIGIKYPKTGWHAIKINWSYFNMKKNDSNIYEILQLHFTKKTLKTLSYEFYHVQYFLNVKLRMKLIKDSLNDPLFCPFVIYKDNYVKKTITKKKKKKKNLNEQFQKNKYYPMWIKVHLLIQHLYCCTNKTEQPI